VGDPFKTRPLGTQRRRNKDNIITDLKQEAGYLSRYSDGGRAEWLRNRASVPGGSEVYVFSTGSRSALMPTQIHIETGGTFFGNKAART
jgi:hypothetical protein